MNYMGGVWVKYRWSMGGKWVKHGLNMGVIWVILVEYGLFGWNMGGEWVEYGWNGLDGMISIIKNGKFELF